jgi:hypothetical protein
MKTQDARHQLEMRAAVALQAALTEVSAIKVKEIRHEPSQPGRDSCLMAYVDLFGRPHTLTCGIHSDGKPQQLRSTLKGLRADKAERDDVMPIIIAPYLSPEEQALCKENKAGYIDLEGNARLALGEVFIVKRTLPQHSHERAASTIERLSAPQSKIAVRSVAKHRNAAELHVAMA